jgi:hypothetical protein
VQRRLWMQRRASFSKSAPPQPLSPRTASKLGSRPPAVVERPSGPQG